jgi:hypothetical protein
MVFNIDDINCSCHTKRATKMICIHELMVLKQVGKLNKKEIMQRCNAAY